MDRNGNGRESNDLRTAGNPRFPPRDLRTPEGRHACRVTHPSDDSVVTRNVFSQFYVAPSTPAGSPRSTAFDLRLPPRRRRPCKFGPETSTRRAFPSFPERPASRKLGKRFGERSVTRIVPFRLLQLPPPFLLASSTAEGLFPARCISERRRPAAAVRRAYKRERESSFSFMGNFFPRLDTPTRSHRIPRWCAVKIGPDASWEIVSKRHTHAVPGEACARLI